MRPVISVVIVNFRSEEFLPSCLDALARNPPRDPFEVILVDNGSPGWRECRLREYAFPVTIIEAHANLGFSRANNRAADRATGDYLLFLNPDTVVCPGALDRLQAVLEGDVLAAAAAPRLKNIDGTLQISATRFYTPLHLPLVFDGVAAKAFPTGMDPFVRLYSSYGRRRPVDWAILAVLLVRRADFEAVGRLDERIFLFAEDVDFCRRLVAKGRRLVFEPAAVVMHHGFGSARKDPVAMTVEKGRGLETYYQIHFPRELDAYYRFREKRRRFQTGFEAWRLRRLGPGRAGRLVKILCLVAQLCVELGFVSWLELRSRVRPR